VTRFLLVKRFLYEQSQELEAVRVHGRTCQVRNAYYVIDAEWLHDVCNAMIDSKLLLH
jgi:hypothetical protein